MATLKISVPPAALFVTPGADEGQQARDLGASGAVPVASVGPTVLVAFGSVSASARKLWENLWFWMVASALVIVGGYCLALWLRSDHGAPPIKLGADFTVFALLYVVAQAIERVTEPFTNLILQTTEASDAAQKGAASALQKLSNNDAAGAKAELERAAARQAEVDELRKWRALFFWAVASALAFGICAYLGVYLIRSIIDVADGAQPPSAKLDLFVTGMAIGGGTKPLHDLISNIQKPKGASAG